MDSNLRRGKRWKRIAVVLLVGMVGLGAGGRAAPEEIVHLAPFDVRESPLGRWGLGWTVRVGLLNKASGGRLPPKEPYVIGYVLWGSPAERAGLAVLDEIQMANGVGFAKRPVREFLQLFETSSAGDRVALGVTDPVTHVKRTVELQLDSGRRWDPDVAGGGYELCLWGAYLAVPRKDMTLTVFPPRWTAHYRPLRVVSFVWRGQRWSAAERPGEGVDWIEGEYRVPRPPKGSAAQPAPSVEHGPLPPLQGRLLPVGAVVTLQPDGGCTIRVPTPAAE